MQQKSLSRVETNMFLFGTPKAFLWALRRTFVDNGRLWVGGCGVASILQALILGGHAALAWHENTGWRGIVTWETHSRGGDVVYQYTLSTLVLDATIWLLLGVLAITIALVWRRRPTPSIRNHHR